MEGPNLCCSLYRALALDPVPVMGDELYVPGAEGVNLKSLREDTLHLCSSHRFNFRRAVAELIAHAPKDERCSCENGRVSVKSSSLGKEMRAAADEVVKADTPGASRRGRGSLAREKPRTPGSIPVGLRARARGRRVQVADPAQERELPQVLRRGVGVSDRTLSEPAPRPIRVQVAPLSLRLLEAEASDRGGSVQLRGRPKGDGRLPDAITIDAFPGRDNFSALYVIGRRIALPAPEYGNRLFGEAVALGLIDPGSSAKAISCEHHQVAMRTEQACVIDLRWNAFDVMSSCLNAVPKIRGMHAVVWSNHAEDPQKTESDVLTWLFGYSNTLPRSVHTVDYKNETLGIRYILLDTDGFNGTMPEPPDGNASCFVHTYFEGDERFASAAVGEVPGTASRMGSPCPNSKAFATWYELPTSLGSSQPTPFSGGVSLRRSPVVSEDLRVSFTEWARRDNEGTSCMSIAVQHTLYYHAKHKKYKLMFHRLAMDRLDEATRWLVAARALHAGALERHTQGPLFSSTEKAVSYLCGFQEKGCGSARDKERRGSGGAGRDISTTKKASEGRLADSGVLRKGTVKPVRAVRGRLHRSHHVAVRSVGRAGLRPTQARRGRPEPTSPGAPGHAAHAVLRDALRGPGGEQAVHVSQRRIGDRQHGPSSDPDAERVTDSGARRRGAPFSAALLKRWWRYQERRSNSTVNVSTPSYFTLCTEDDPQPWTPAFDAFEVRKPEPLYSFLRDKCRYHETRGDRSSDDPRSLGKLWQGSLARVRAIPHAEAVTFVLSVLMPKQHLEQTLHNLVRTHRAREAVMVRAKGDLRGIGLSAPMEPRVDCIGLERVNRDKSVVLHVVSTLERGWQSLEYWLTNDADTQLRDASIVGRVLAGVLGSLRDLRLSDQRLCRVRGRRRSPP
ncbi:hypothetical protein Q5P01_000741 [Channa striata]|uniref:Uncharacterized protein n=1 Tax=Channa striata TaxID=64152 RepID=A0AA88IID1_CHASR|nr:hypothetical protein Q5P01_000741 [Channa striata]